MISVGQLVQRRGSTWFALRRCLSSPNSHGLVLVPGDFALAHPERLDRDLDLRAFVVLAALLRGRAAHLERAARDRHHVERELRSRQGLAVRFHPCLLDGRRVLRRQRRLGEQFHCRSHQVFQGLGFVLGVHLAGPGLVLLGSHEASQGQHQADRSRNAQRRQAPGHRFMVVHSKSPCITKRSPQSGNFTGVSQRQDLPTRTGSASCARQGWDLRRNHRQPCRVHPILNSPVGVCKSQRRKSP